MGRLAHACVLVACATAIAHARPTRKVRVESTPPRATVYVDTIDNGAACEETPCTIDVPLDAETLIVRLEGHGAEFVPLDLRKGKKPYAVSVKLTAAIGTLVIDAPRGASVRVNDEDKGKVPVRVEVPADNVRVIVTLAGKTLHDDFVEVVANEEKVLKVSAATASTTATRADPDDGDDDDDDAVDLRQTDGDDDRAGSIRGKVAGEPRAHYLEAGLAFDIGFRRFVFSDGGSPFSNSGEVVIGPAVALWPGRLLGVHLLRNLSLFGRAQFSVNHQTVTRQMNGMTVAVGAETVWGASELSLRNRWTFSTIGLEAGVGFVRDQVGFAANDAVLMQVPSADYRSIRIGVRASLVGSVEPYVSAENRIVLSGGQLADRADNADASGYRFAAGLATTLGPFGARAEGSYAQYSWTFSNVGTAPPPAPAATDKIFWISFVLGYQY
jgi:hypothetical protein